MTFYADLNVLGFFSYLLSTTKKEVLYVNVYFIANIKPNPD